MSGTLYIVATPIGNLGDFSLRALDVMKQVDFIACEDTRTSKKLLQHYSIDKRLFSLHDHNEAQRLPWLQEQLSAGKDVALISDAGTPLISDPGYVLVSRLGALGFKIVPIPGASAMIAALSVAGLPTDRFCFEGFLPAKQGARLQRLQALMAEDRTITFYESTHRIVAMLRDCESVFGADRQMVICKELTKLYETVVRGSVATCLEWLQSDSDHCRGEFVVLLRGYQSSGDGLTPEALRVLGILREALSLKQAARLTSEITGEARNLIYKRRITNANLASP